MHVNAHNIPRVVLAPATDSLYFQPKEGGATTIGGVLALHSKDRYASIERVYMRKTPLVAVVFTGDSTGKRVPRPKMVNISVAPTMVCASGQRNFLTEAQRTRISVKSLTLRHHNVNGPSSQMNHAPLHARLFMDEVTTIAQLRCKSDLECACQLKQILCLQVAKIKLPT